MTGGGIFREPTPSIGQSSGISAEEREEGFLEPGLGKLRVIIAGKPTEMASLVHRNSHRV